MLIIIKFEDYYINPDNISYIGTTKKDGEAFPYRLSVQLKSGENLCVTYQSEESRDKAKMYLVNQIENEKRRQTENIEVRLCQIKQLLETVDRRQKTIRRQLKSLLDLPEENEE